MTLSPSPFLLKQRTLFYPGDNSWRLHQMLFEVFAKAYTCGFSYVILFH